MRPVLGDASPRHEQTFWRTETRLDLPLASLAAGGIADTEFRLLADNIPSLCWIANGDGYIVWYNRRWHEYAGTTPAQMEGWGWQSVHHPDVLPQVMERWQASILSQLAEGVIVTDAAGRITFVNAAAARIHGVKRLDVAPGDYSDTYHLFTEEGEPYPPDRLPLARVVATGDPVSAARWRIRTPDGREVVAVGNACPVTGEDGARIGSVLTMRD